MGQKLAEILRVLVPNNEEELTLLQSILQWAQRTQTGVAPSRNPFLVTAASPVAEYLPAEFNRYFHSLVEALEIYQSIHGVAIPVDALTVQDKFFYEIRQIRDLCLQEGLHSIY